MFTTKLDNRRVFDTTMRGKGIGSVMLRVAERLESEVGTKKLKVRMVRESALNLFLKHGYKPSDPRTADFVERYLKAEDKKKFRAAHAPDILVDPKALVDSRLDYEQMLHLEKELEPAPDNPGKHSLLAVMPGGREKWHYIPKEALERA